ncbi:hypothetical protein [Lyngbya sp. PCC 8106]
MKEGLNNRTQLILRQSYGFKSFKMMGKSD